VSHAFGDKSTLATAALSRIQVLDEGYCLRFFLGGMSKIFIPTLLLCLVVESYQIRLPFLPY
jgi:hypothetical protein